MPDWSTDTWLLVGIVLTGVISAAIAGFGVYRQMWRAKRDRTWRRLDRLSVPLDEWAATIGILNPMWAQSPHNGDMTVIPSSTYDAAIHATMPKRLVGRVDRFFAERRSYASDCLDLYSAVQAKVLSESGLGVVDYSETGEGLYLRSHFAQSIFCAIYTNIFMPKHNDYEYQDLEKSGSSPAGTIHIFEQQFKWPRGPMDNWIVSIFEHASYSDSGPLIVDAFELKTLHQRMLGDTGIEGASMKMSDLEKRFRSLEAESIDLQSEIADFRAH